MRRGVQSYEIEVHHLDGCVRVELGGELDLLAAPALQDALRGLAYRYDGDQVTLDFAGATFVDMSTIGQLVAMAHRLDGGRPTLVGASPSLVRILGVTDVLDLFTIQVDQPLEASSRA